MSLTDLKPQLDAFLDHQQRVMTVFQSMTAMIERQGQEIETRGLLLAEILMLLETDDAEGAALKLQRFFNRKKAAVN